MRLVVSQFIVGAVPTCHPIPEEVKLSNYTNLTDEEKILLGIECVARGVDMPEPIKAYLLEVGLYEPIVNPKGT